MKKQLTEDNTPDSVKVEAAFLQAVHTVKHSTDAHQVAILVEQNKLSLAHVPTNLQKNKEVRAWTNVSV